MEERGLRLGEDRVEIAVLDRERQVAHPVGEHDRDAERRRQLPLEQGEVAQVPAADVGEAREEDPPRAEPQQVVPEHEEHLHPERRAHRPRGAQVGAEQRHEEGQRRAQAHV